MTAHARSRRNTAGALLAGTVCAALVAGLSGCAGEDPDEGTNGVGRLSANAIEKKARAAARSAGSVRLSGDIVTKGRTYELEMSLTGTGGTGKVSAEGGDTFELLRVDKDLYLKAGAGFWASREKGGGSGSDGGAARKLEGKYVKVPSGDPSYGQLSGFTEMRVLLDGLLTLDGKRETGARGEVGGTRTIGVRAGKGSGGVLDVSLIGTPYPLRVKRGGGAGTVLLKDWDKDVALHAPAKSDIVDYGHNISATAPDA